MTPNRLITHNQTIKETNYKYDDFEIVWAGEYGWGEGYCFGSEDGRVRLSATGEEILYIDAEAAINGVAFTNRAIAISTTEDVYFWANYQSNRDDRPESMYPGGAHNVIATPTGNFVAPLGPNGLLEITSDPDQPELYHWARVEDRKSIFYKVASVGTHKNLDVYIYALRRGGWARRLLGGSSGFDVAVEPSVDIVDVCHLRSDQFPRAAVALGADNSLRLIADVLKSTNMILMRLGELRGTAYQILSNEKQAFLLTSEFLYPLGDLLYRCLEDGRADVPTTLRKIDLEAVCVSIAHGRDLLIVRPDGGVSVMALDDLTTIHEGDSSVTLTPSLTSFASSFTPIPIVAA